MFLRRNEKKYYQDIPIIYSYRTGTVDEKGGVYTNVLLRQCVRWRSKYAKDQVTRQSAQWGTYTPEERYRQFLTSTKYVALTLEMVGWMNSMLIAISPKPLCRRIIKFNKRSWWYSYINLDAIFFYFYMKFLSLWPWPEGHTLYLPTCQI